MFQIKILSEYDEERGNLLDNIDNTSNKIKPIDKKDANSEIEVAEYVLNPNLVLKKALGKSHAKGGTPVFLEPGAFIYSNYTGLSLNKNDKERFEFKLGGKKLKANTPAKILEKNIDVAHHNKMLNILDSKSQDDIAKNSAMLMLEKNIKTLGKIAYVQEGKKGFPEGVPDFAKGTAPIYDSNVDNDITQSKQYMKYGGFKKFQAGGSKYDYPDYLKEYFSNNRAENMFGSSSIQVPQLQHKTGETYDNALFSPEFKDYHKWFFGNNPNASVLDFQKAYDEYYNQATGEHYFNNNDNNPANDFDGKHGNWTAAAPLFKYNRTTSEQLPITNIPGTNIPFQAPAISFDPKAPYKYIDRSEPIPVNNIMGLQATDTTQISPTSVAPGILKPNEVASYVQDGTSNVGLTAFQKFNVALPLLQKLGIKSQYPLRQQIKRVVPQLSQVSAQPYLNAVDSQYNNASGINRSINPMLAYANNAEMYGKSLEAKNQAISNVMQQNNQIGNAQTQMNAEAQNQDMSNNMEFNQKYYDQVQNTLQNKQRYKDYYNTKFIDNMNTAVAENQAFNNTLSSLPLYKTNRQIGTRDGKPVYAAERPYTAVSNGFGYNFKANQNIDLQSLLTSPMGIGSSSNQAVIQRLEKLLLETTDQKAKTALAIKIAELMSPKNKLGGILKYKKK